MMILLDKIHKISTMLNCGNREMSSNHMPTINDSSIEVAPPSSSSYRVFAVNFYRQEITVAFV